MTKKTDTEPDLNLFNAENPGELSDSFSNLEVYMDREDRDMNKRRIGAWLISFATHATVGLIFSIIVFTTMRDEDKYEYPPMQIAFEQPKEVIKPIDKLPTKLVEETPNNIKELDKADDHPIIINPVEAEVTEEKFEMPKGELDNMSVSDLGGKGFNFAIGAGGGGSGIYGDRNGTGKRIAMIRGYGPKARGAEGVINKGLMWLKKHQGPLGEWKATTYYQNCQEDNKCEPGLDNKGDTTIALTAYSCLSFLANGYDHMSPNTYKSVIEKGLYYILNQQKADGSLGERIYEHAIATQCLSEALAMSNDSKLKGPVNKAIKFLLMQDANSSGHLVGWDYTAPNPSRIDYSVSGWGLFALKAGMSADVPIGNSMVGFKYSIENAWQAVNPDYKKFTNSDKSVFPYTWNSTTGKTEKNHLSFVAACALSFLGHKRGDVMLDTLINDMNDRFLINDEYKNNAYALYYASLATFNAQNSFHDWADKFVPYLISIQIGGNDCHTGTFDYPQQSFHGWDTSRVLIHNYYLLALSVVYRFKLTETEKH